MKSETFEKSQMSEPIDVPGGEKRTKSLEIIFCSDTPNTYTLDETIQETAPLFLVSER